MADNETYEIQSVKLISKMIDVILKQMDTIHELQEYKTIVEEKRRADGLIQQEKMYANITQPMMGSE